MLLSSPRCVASTHISSIRPSMISQTGGQTGGQISTMLMTSSDTHDAVPCDQVMLNKLTAELSWCFGKDKSGGPAQKIGSNLSGCNAERDAEPFRAEGKAILTQFLLLADLASLSSHCSSCNVPIKAPNKPPTPTGCFPLRPRNGGKRNTPGYMCQKCWPRSRAAPCLALSMHLNFLLLSYLGLNCLTSPPQQNPSGQRAATMRNSSPSLVTSVGFFRMFFQEPQPLSGFQGVGLSRSFATVCACLSLKELS